MPSNPPTLHPSNPPTLKPSNPHAFWNRKRVFLTGHTGFKGAWLSIWLDALGAEVTGYALKPPTKPSLFELCGLGRSMNSVIADIRDAARLQKAVLAAKPEIIIHMAAQPLVRRSYKDPRETYETNVMGTVNLLEAAGKCASVKAVVNVTTDKCYENKERLRGYKEDEPLGGYDPYSSSKACSELVTSAYRNSFFNPRFYSISNQPSNPRTLQPSNPPTLQPSNPPTLEPSNPPTLIHSPRLGPRRQCHRRGGLGRRQAYPRYPGSVFERAESFNTQSQSGTPLAVRAGTPWRLSPARAKAF